jgi:gliding motility-associated-like protein
MRVQINLIAICLCMLLSLQKSVGNNFLRLYTEMPETLIENKKLTFFFQATPPATSPDQPALVALYNATAGAGWTNPWDLTKPITEWAGVTVNPTTLKVTKIDLSNRNLVGTLPAAFFALSDITELRLNNNKLTGVVPDALNSLKELTLLYLHENQFIWKFPAIADLTKLVKLNLSKNRFRTLPKFPTNSFTELVLNNNQITFESLEDNVTLPTIKYLPQDSLATDTTVTRNEGDNVSIATKIQGLDIGGSTNSYTWFKLKGSIYEEIAQSGRELTFPDITAADAGLYRLRVTNSKVSDLTLFRAVIRLRVNPCTVSRTTIKESQSYCEGDELPTLVGDEAKSGINTLKITYQWQRTTDSTSVDSWIDVGGTEKDYTITGLVATTWYRRIARDGRCKENISNIVKITFVKKIANNTIKIAKTVLCDATKPDSLLGIIPTGGDGKPKYQWQSSKNGATWLDEDKTRNYFPIISADTMFFRRIVSGTCGKPDTSAVLIIRVVKPLAKNEIGSNQFVCPNGTGVAMRDSIKGFKVDSLSFRYAWQASFDRVKWTRADTTRLQKDTLYFFAPTGITKTTYFRRIVYNGCDSTISNILNVQIHPKILNNIISTSNSIVCEGDTTARQLTGTVPVGGGQKYKFLWQSSIDKRTWTNRGDTLNLKNPAVTADSTYFRRIVESLCYKDTSNSVTVLFSRKFGRNEIGPKQLNCVGNASSVIKGTSPAFPRSYFKYDWIYSSDSINWQRPDTLGNLQDYKPDTLAQGKYFFRRLVLNGCSVDSSNIIEIEMVNPIKNNTIEGGGRYCVGNTLPKLVGSVPTGGGSKYEYEWQNSTDNKNWAFTGKEKDFTPTSLIRSTLFRRVVSGEQCGKDTSNVIEMRMINKLSNNRITDNQNICVGEALKDSLRGTLPVGGDSTYRYVWQATSDTIWRSVASTRNFLPKDIVEAVKFRRIVTSGCFSDTSNTIQVTVNQRITNNFILSGGQTVCRKTKADPLRASKPVDGTNIFKYQWQQSRDQRRWTNISNANTQNLAFNNTPDSTTFYRRIVSNLCFGDTTPSQRILVLQTPRITAGRDTIVDIGFEIRLQGSGAVNYLWFPKDAVDDSTARDPLAKPLRTTQYIVQGTDASGCVGFDTVLVIVANEPVTRAVDVITPNGDGLNDVFHIDNIEKYPDNLLIIVNRWGSEVYRKVNYKNDWDGTYGGAVLPTGVYFYILTVKGTSKERKGAIHLLE